MKLPCIALSLSISLLALAGCQQTASEGFTTSQEIETNEAMLQHNVYFYLNEDVTDEQKAEFEQGLKELLSIDEIHRSELGTPGPTPERDVTDHSFAYSIFTWFQTMDDYDVYADHPDHLEFIDKYSHLWADAKVYDSQIIDASE